MKNPRIFVIVFLIIWGGFLPFQAALNTPLHVGNPAFAATKKPVKKSIRKKTSTKKVTSRAPSFAYAKQQASIVVDADTGEILHASNADAKAYPASMTKMMTLYLTFEALNAGRLNLSSRVPVSSRAAAQKPTKLGVKPGASVSVEQAILAIVTKSANDISYALAEKISGSHSGFVHKMNRTARSLGMRHTAFQNAHGLPDPGQISTARDMAILSLALMKNQSRYYRFFSTRDFNYRGESIHTHNRLLDSYYGADGIKTGYTNASGFNLAASAKRNGKRLVGVVFGGDSWASRNARMEQLLDTGFARAGRTDATRAAYIFGTPNVLVAGGDVQYADGTAQPMRATKTATGPITPQDRIPPPVPQQKPIYMADNLQTDTNDVGAVDLPPTNAVPIQMPDNVAPAPVMQTKSAPTPDVKPDRVVQMRPVGAAVSAPDSSASVMQLRIPPPIKPAGQAVVTALVPPKPLAQQNTPDNPTTVEGSWLIQIGAYPALDQAQMAVVRAQNKLPASMRRGSRILTLIDSMGQTLYGARLGSYTSDETQTACKYLDSCVVISEIK